MNFDEIDRSISAFMRRWGILALRISFGIIFIWFGVLKPLGLSAAAPLVMATVRWLPLFDGELWVIIIGWWEVAIGISFLFRRTIRVAIALLAIQLVGTFMPLILLPAVTFQAGHLPYGPTIEGQYIIKNLLIISAALVVGGTVRRSAGSLASPLPGARRPQKAAADAALLGDDSWHDGRAAGRGLADRQSHGAGPPAAES